MKSIDLVADRFSKNKLNARQYGNLTALESDLKRMVQNAKEFNDTRTTVYEDAERIRKALSNFMPKNNPAYKDETYRALPTAIPDDNGGGFDNQQFSASPVAAPAPAMIKLRINGSAPRKSRSGMKEETVGEGDDMTQQEQLKIVGEMIQLRDSRLVVTIVCLLKACSGLPGAAMRPLK